MSDKAPLTNEGNALTDLRYANPSAIEAVRYDPDTTPWSGRTITGYGGRLPTPYRVLFNDGVWRRVRAMCYGNAASYYVILQGKLAHLDSWAEGYLEDARKRYHCQHLSCTEVGAEPDGAIIYECDSCGDRWNGGAE